MVKRKSKISRNMIIIIAFAVIVIAGGIACLAMPDGIESLRAGIGNPADKCYVALSNRAGSPLNEDKAESFDEKTIETVILYAGAFDSNGEPDAVVVTAAAGPETNRTVKFSVKENEEFIKIEDIQDNKNAKKIVVSANDRKIHDLTVKLSVLKTSGYFNIRLVPAITDIKPYNKFTEGIVNENPTLLTGSKIHLKFKVNLAKGLKKKGLSVGKVNCSVKGESLTVSRSIAKFNRKGVFSVYVNARTEGKSTLLISGGDFLAEYDIEVIPEAKAKASKKHGKNKASKCSGNDVSEDVKPGTAPPNDTHSEDKASEDKPNSYVSGDAESDGDTKADTKQETNSGGDSGSGSSKPESSPEENQ